MKISLIVAVMATGLICRAEDTKPAENKVDPDVYRAAMEKLAAKSSVPTTQPQTMEQLLAENAALRQRVAELEAMLGLKNRPIAQRQAKTFTTVQDMINAVKFPADPKRPWTEIQLQRAQHDAEAVLVGCTFAATGNLKSATIERPTRLRSAPPLPARGFHCTFSHAGGEDVQAFFDVRYSDLITSWKVGQSVSFSGAISSVEVRQVRRDGGLQLHLAFEISDCVPKK